MYYYEKKLQRWGQRDEGTVEAARKPLELQGAGVNSDDESDMDESCSGYYDTSESSSETSRDKKNEKEKQQQKGQ